MKSLSILLCVLTQNTDYFSKNRLHLQQLAAFMGRGEDITDICERYLSKKEEREDVKKAVMRCLDKNDNYDKMKVGFPSTYLYFIVLRIHPN